jgi:hypothetical protein
MQNASNGDDVNHGSYCDRLKGELSPCQDWFLTKDQWSGKDLDVVASFCPSGISVLAWKIVATGLTWGTLLYNWISDTQTALNSVFWTKTPQTPQITFPKTPQTRLK